MIEMVVFLDSLMKFYFFSMMKFCFQQKGEKGQHNNKKQNRTPVSALTKLSF